jgi:hypothetical protein
MFNFVASFDTSFTLNDLWFMIKGAGTTLALTFWAILGGNTTWRGVWCCEGFPAVVA